MPRLKGHDGRAEALLERLESSKAHLVRMTFDLQLVQLRARQATRSPERSDELLEPADETLVSLLDRVNSYQKEIDAAIRLLAAP